MYLGDAQHQGHCAAPARLAQDGARLLGRAMRPMVPRRQSRLLGLRAPCKDEHGDIYIYFLLQMNVCTVVFLHLPGISVYELLKRCHSWQMRCVLHLKNCESAETSGRSGSRRTRQSLQTAFFSWWLFSGQPEQLHSQACALRAKPMQHLTARLPC